MPPCITPRPCPSAFYWKPTGVPAAKLRAGIAQRSTAPPAAAVSSEYMPLSLPTECSSARLRGEAGNASWDRETIGGSRWRKRQQGHRCCCGGGSGGGRRESGPSSSWLLFRPHRHSSQITQVKRTKKSRVSEGSSPLSLWCSGVLYTCLLGVVKE